MWATDYNHGGVKVYYDDTTSKWCVDYGSYRELYNSRDIACRHAMTYRHAMGYFL